MSALVNPFPGQKTRRVLNWGDSSSDSPIEEIRPEEADLESADIVTSEVASGDGTRHKVVIDVDFPIVVLDSATPGHHHLFIDKELGWEEYLELLRVLVKVGIVEDGYLGASEHRGFTGVRLPWIGKPQAVAPKDADTPPLPDSYRLGGVTYGKWRDDLENVATRLEPWVTTFVDPGSGSPCAVIDRAAPGPLQELYSGLVSVGYAHGWLPLGDEEVAA